MAKVPWSKEDKLRYEDMYDDSVIYEFENDEALLRQFEEWKEFKENDYYDGTPPPDFVTTITEEEWDD